MSAKFATVDSIRVGAERALEALALGTLANVLESGTAAKGRIALVTDSDRGWMVRLHSDGLTLADKLLVEQEIRRELPDATLVIYFARRQGATAAAGAPTQDGPRPMAFGLKMQRTAIPGVRNVLVVGSGKGGVGKSTVSSNLAVSLAQQGLRVGLLDADVHGPSAPIMFGLGGALAVNSDGKIIPARAHGVDVVSTGFLVEAQNPIIWRGPMVGKAIQQFCYDVAWGDKDVLVVDLPPGTGDVQITLMERLPIHGAVVVTTPQDVALIDAHKAVSMFQKLNIPIHGVVENMAMFQCPHCGGESHIFGDKGLDEFCRDRQTRLLGRLPLALEIRQGGDAGLPAALVPGSVAEQVFSKIAIEFQRFLAPAGTHFSALAEIPPKQLLVTNEL